MEYTRETRGAILQYRCVDSLTYDQIATRIEGVTANGARKLCTRARKRANTDNPSILRQHAQSAARTGRPRRVQPGSPTSTRIQQSIRGPNKWENPVEAANRVHKIARQKSDRTPLKPLAINQVNRILRLQDHYDSDTLDKRPINRNRSIVKKALSNKDYTAREAYIERILGLCNADTVLICMDETPIHFGGDSTKQHVSIPAGAREYNEVKDNTFSRMQWAAACSNTRIKRPHLI